jgi:hypothetical protein
MSGTDHPSSECAYCGKSLGRLDGNVTLGPEPGTITVYCDDEDCRRQAYEDSPDDILTDGGTPVDGISQTRVGHCKADSTDVYVGRGPGGRSMHDTPIGERGWLGNPYPADEYGRGESIENFREAFEEKLKLNDAFREAVGDLAGQDLGCWCQHLDEDGPACHAEIIAEHADRISRQVGADTDHSRGDSDGN